MRPLLLSALTAALPLVACGERPREPRVEVADAWVHLPALPGGPASAYFTLRSDGGPVSLIRVTSPHAERVELHESRTEGAATHMSRIEAAQLPVDRELPFRPGGRHVMLLAPEPALRPGDPVRLTFRFDRAPPITVEAKARRLGEAPGP